MNVPSTLMIVLTTVQTPMDPIHVVADLDTDWLPTDILVKVPLYFPFCVQVYCISPVSVLYYSELSFDLGLCK